jgi:hypothetical protein
MTFRHIITYFFTGYGETCTVGRTTTTTEPTVSPNFCDGINVGVFAHPTECTMFVVCLFEVPGLHTCPYPTEVFYDGSCVEGNFIVFHFLTYY